MNNLREFAIYIAGVAHGEQKYGENFYYYHLNCVDKVLHSAGFLEHSVERIAAWLHDVLEDTNFTAKDIERYFGPKVLMTVQAVTDEDGDNRRQRAERTYPKIRRLGSAVAVKLADRIANMEHSFQNQSYQSNMYASETMFFKQELYGVFMDDERIMYLWNRFELANDKIIEQI